MYTVSYFKFGSRWYLDLPEYLEKGQEDDLEHIGTFQTFLEIAARHQDSVTFIMDINTFEGSDVLTLISSSGERSGGYYHIKSLESKVIDLELWFNCVIYFGQQYLPPKYWCGPCN